MIILYIYCFMKLKFNLKYIMFIIILLGFGYGISSIWFDYLFISLLFITDYSKKIYRRALYNENIH